MELSLHQGTGQSMPLLPQTCCGARRHRPPGNATALEKSRGLLLMQLTFSLRGQSLSQFPWHFYVFVRPGWNPGRICTCRSWMCVKRARKKGQMTLCEKDYTLYLKIQAHKWLVFLCLLILQALFSWVSACSQATYQTDFLLLKWCTPSLPFFFFFPPVTPFHTPALAMGFHTIWIDVSSIWQGSDYHF